MTLKSDEHVYELSVACGGAARCFCSFSASSAELIHWRSLRSAGMRGCSSATCRKSASASSVCLSSLRHRPRCSGVAVVEEVAEAEGEGEEVVEEAAEEVEEAMEAEVGSGPAGGSTHRWG